MSNKSNLRKRNSSNTLPVRIKPQRESIQTNLDGAYWNDLQNDHRTNGKTKKDLSVYDFSVSENSSSDDSTDTELLNTSSSENSDDENDPNLLYKKEAFVTCRSPSDTFYLCRLLQNVYTRTKSIRIRWCSVIGEDGDDTKISIHTRFQLSYKDKLDPNAILMEISKIIDHGDETLSLKKQDIVDTKRLLEKSIRADSISSDDMMDLSTEHQQPTKKTSKRSHLRFASTDDSDNSSSSESSEEVVSTTNKKRKKTASKPKSRKQPAKKRRQTKDASDKSDDQTKSAKPKKKAPVRKAKLFKVQSNRLLEENTAITEYKKEPFFEDNITVPFVSSYVKGKLAIRSVLIDDNKLLKSLIDDTDHVCSVHVSRSLHNDLSAIHYAIKNNNIRLVKILLDDLKSPKKLRCPFPIVSMKTQDTGSANILTLGFRTAPIMASRGVKEGNNALNKDQMSPKVTNDGYEIFSYALINNCSRELYDLIVKTYPHIVNTAYESIDKIIQNGHRQLAASIIGEIKDNAFHGFNFLHHQVLLYDNEDITINRASSIIKKARQNMSITPIHCAAINPNAKYLKQLLTIMPEYNILDKYERRPIHFAAACEGSDPLEYLISKLVNINDIDRGGNSPLHIAAMTGRAHNVECLLRTAKEKSESNDVEDEVLENKFGLASINRTNKSRFYPLHLAVSNNHLDCVRILVEYGANIDIPTSTASGKLTSLMLACQKGYFDIVKYLIEKGAKVENRDRFKRTPLIHACMCGNAHIVSYLLRLGANANVFDSSLNTALHYAIAYGWYFCVQLLLEAGADANCVNSWQTTCLATGFLKGHYGLCDYLLTNHNVDINFQTEDGSTLVMLTVGLEISSAVVAQLEYVVIKHKADCTTIDASGNNAFHYLASNVAHDWMDENSKKLHRENSFKIAKILLDHHCNPNQLNSKSQSPLMIALEAGNFVLVDYLINEAKIEVNSDISQDGKTLLHYFAMKCDQYDLIQALLKLPINDEIKKMGQIFDNSGRTPLHYCTKKFQEFCERNQKSTSTDQLKKQYQSIVQMIEYCLESVGCDPDAEIQLKEESKVANDTDDDDDGEEEEEEAEPNDEEMEDDKIDDNEEGEQSMNRPANIKLKETGIFSLLLSVSFIESTERHPLDIFVQKTKNINVLHHENHRTPLLQAISQRQIQTALILINHPQCDLNLSTSNIANEKQQTPLILACKLQLLSIIDRLLGHKQCNLLLFDYQNNQALHYYLQTSNRSNEYIEILNLFIEKLKLITTNPLNTRGKCQRTPLHIAIYHNLGTIDATTDVEKLLIDNGSDLFLEDDRGSIPLHNVFLNKIGADPVELCVLILKAMKYKSLDTKNQKGFTPLHSAVLNGSTVCVMLLQQHHASLLIEDNEGHSIVGTCIVAGHLNLFITFLQQSIDIDLGKMYLLPEDSSSKKTKIEKTSWKWKYIQQKSNQQRQQYSLIHLIIQRDWQGALALILNDINRFHLKYIQVFEAAILNQKLNLVIRLLLRLKEENIVDQKNSLQQNLFHLLANLETFDENLFKQIFIFLVKTNFQWNTPDSFNSYPLHYAYVKRNLTFIELVKGLYPDMDKITPNDRCHNTFIGLLFWSLGSQTIVLQDKFRTLITSGKQLDCLCNYQNEHLLDPLAFNYQSTETNRISYPPIKSNNQRTSPLIHAIVHNNFVLAKFLIELDADVNFPDENQQTPLMYAVRQNNLDLVKLLLNKTYSSETKPEPSPFGFHPARRFGRGRARVRRVARQRFFLGATTTEQPEETPEPETEEKVDKKFQMTSSINLNAVDRYGRTCIHYLVQPFSQGTYTNNLELLRLLHSFGASLTKTDRSGLTPLEYSLQMNNQHLTDELRKLINNKKVSMKQMSIEQFTVNDPNANLLSDHIDFYHDAQKLIDDYLASHPTNQSKTKYPVDPTSGMSLTGEVVFDTDKDEPYDVRLTKVDVSYGICGLYNFYRMQIIKHKAKKNLVFLFTRWGRIGYDEGQHQLTPFSTLDECRQEFLKVFREKTGNSWDNTDEFEAKAKKYTLVRLNERELKQQAHVPVNFDRLQAENEHPTSKIQLTPYKNLFRIFLHRQALRQTGPSRTNLDVDWMPASQLKREVLEQARDILSKIKDIIEKKQKLSTDPSLLTLPDTKQELTTYLKLIYDYSNEYHQLIPVNNFSIEKLTIIEDMNILKQQEKLLDDFFQLELTYKILLGAQANLKQMAPIDYIYKSLNCQFEILNENDAYTQLILRYIWTTAPNIQVEQIFKIARADEDERLRKTKIENRYLLWHGTNVCNLVSILTRGLIAGTLAADATGNLFGTGIYTADAFAKSLGYCSGVTEKNEETCFMLLCEVALGNSKKIGLRPEEKDENNEEEEDNDDDMDKPLDSKKYQSLKSYGQQMPDPKHTITLKSGVQMPLGQLIPNKDSIHYGYQYNEYIVYDEAQIALRYLVQFRR